MKNNFNFTNVNFYKISECGNLFDVLRYVNVAEFRINLTDIHT